MSILTGEISADAHTAGLNYEDHSSVLDVAQDRPVLSRATEGEAWLQKRMVAYWL